MNVERSEHLNFSSAVSSPGETPRVASVFGELCVQPGVKKAIEKARAAYHAWRTRSVSERLKVIRAFRLEIGRNPRKLAETVKRPHLAETLAAEVLPLADACRFLELNASQILRDQVVGQRGRPMWLWGNQLRLLREPYGIVLIVAPANYPLMLAGIQAIQALVAGNAVLIKPGIGGTLPAMALTELLIQCGLPASTLQVLPESKEAVAIAMQQGVDKVVVTGSVDTGRSIARNAAEHAVPAIMELSGCDAMFVLEDADVDLVSDCLLFGLILNQSQTCIAPRRVFASPELTGIIIKRLLEKLGDRPSLAQAFTATSRLAESAQNRQHAAAMIEAAVSEGATLATEPFEKVDGRLVFKSIAVLDNVRPEMKIVRVDPSFPVVSFLRVSNEQEALDWSRQCGLALGATVFGSRARCENLARRIDAGVIVINDVITATADPRVPFGGRHQSGYGMTRGAAGLEEMTQLKSIVRPRNWFRPHLKPVTPVDADVLEQLIRIEHSENVFAKWKAIPGMIAASIAQFRFLQSKKRSSSE